MYRHSKLNHEFSYPGDPKTCYLICSTPRCGSSFLCEALFSTGLAGAPTEYFDDGLMGRFRKRWKAADDRDYFRALFRKKTSRNRVFGCKVHFHQFQQNFLQRDAMHLFSNLQFISIQRKDQLRQAISYWKALQNNQWASTHSATQSELKYSFEEIKNLKLRISNEQKLWNEFFQTKKIEPLVLYYEDIASDLLAAVRSIFDFLQIDQQPELVFDNLTLKKQSNEISDIWYERFLRELSAPT